MSVAVSQRNYLMHTEDSILWDFPVPPSVLPLTFFQPYVKTVLPSETETVSRLDVT